MADNSTQAATKQPKVLLVIECTPVLNWYKIFEGATVLGHPIQVEQAEWGDISLVSYGRQGGCVASIRRAAKPLPGTSQERERTVKVDFVLLRSVTRHTWTLDSRNLLWALMHANVPSVNSLKSAYMCLERPIVYGALLEIQQRLGKDVFPLIEQTYYPSNKQMLITPEFPLVVKIGPAHAGYGKMKINNMTDFQDLAGVVAMTPHYATAEKYYAWQWDGRVQKIGNHYRVFKRVSQNWKGNVGNMSMLETIEVTEQFKLWADECAKAFGGLDILGLDFVCCDGKFVILELNDTAIGLVHKYEEEDMMHMRDLVLMRMEQHWSTKEASSENSTDDVAALQEKIKLLEIEVAREREARKRAEDQVEILKQQQQQQQEKEEKSKSGFFSSWFA